MNAINNLSVRKKMLIGFVCVLLLLIFISILSIIRMNAMRAQYEDVINRVIASQHKAQTAQTEITSINAGIRGYLLFNDDNLIKQAENANDSLKRTLEQLQGMIIAEENVQLLKVILEKSNEYGKVLDAVREAGKSDPEQAKQLAVAGRLHLEAAVQATDKLVVNQNAASSQAAVEINDDVQFSVMMVVVTAIIAVLLGCVTCVIVYFSTSGVVKKIIVYTNQVLASAQEIMASTEQIASGSQTQAMSAETSSSMVNEMTSAVHSVAISSEQASVAADQVVELAQSGNKVIQETISGMKDISAKIEELAARSEKIGDIIEVIDEIADQTNLLALNAALEAARAGSAGKGFAVVADEVRKLAERSGSATKEIAGLIKSMQQNTREAVVSTKAGDEASSKAGIAFEEIRKTIQVTAVRITEIAAACEQQSSQSTEIQTNIQSIAAITEETAAGAEETASSTTEMVKMVEHMNTLMTKL